MKQKEVAVSLGRNPSWVSRSLSAPGNWTLRTIGELTEALRGEVVISIAAKEDRPEQIQNYDAYDGYIGYSCSFPGINAEMAGTSSVKMTFHFSHECGQIKACSGSDGKRTGIKLARAPRYVSNAVRANLTFEKVPA